MLRNRACSIAVGVWLSALACVVATADLSQTAQSANNNGITYHPFTTYTVVSSTPGQGTTWVTAPSTGGRWVTQQAWPATPSLSAASATATAGAGAGAGAALGAGAGPSNDPTPLGRRRRSRRHRHHYPPGAAAGTPVPATPLPDSSSSTTSSMTVGSATAQPGMARTFLPGKGWATIVWAPGTAAGGPNMPGAALQGPAGDTSWPGPGGPDEGQPNMQPPGQPGRGSPGGMGGMWQRPGMAGARPILPGGTRRGGGLGLAMGTPAIPMQSPIPAGSWGGSSGGPWSSGSQAGWPVPSPRPGDEDSSDDDEDPDEPTGPPQWPWPGSPLSPGSSENPSRPGAAGADLDDDNDGYYDGDNDGDYDSDDDSMMGRPAWVGAGPGPRGPRTGPWAAAAASPRPGSGSVAESMWPARLSSPRPQPTVVTGPSETDPDRPWLFRSSPSPSPSAWRPGGPSLLQPGRGSPSPSPSPGVRAPWGVGTGATTRPGDMPQTSPTPSSTSTSSSGSGSTVGEWDEGMGDDGSDDQVPPPAATSRPSDRPGMGTGTMGPGMGLGIGPSPSGAATAGRSPSPSPSPSPSAKGSPGSSPGGAQPSSGLVTGSGPRPSPPLRGASPPGLAAPPSPRPFVQEDPDIPGSDDDTPEPLGVEDVDSPEDVDIIDTMAAEEEDDEEEEEALTAGSMGPVSGLVTGGGLVVRPGSGIGSAEPTPAASPKPGAAAAAGAGPGAAPLAGRGNASAAAAGGLARPGMGPAAGQGMQPGAGARPGGMQPAGSGTVSEAGSRGGNASSTAATLPTSFTLSPAISQQPGSAGAGGMAGGAGGAGGAVVPTAVGSDGAMDASPKPYLWKSPQGAKKTVLVGCILPFEGNQAVVGKAVHSALQMALQDLGGSLKVPLNINLTCLNTKCTDIPSHNAMRRLASMGAVGVIGDICSAATVAAAGVAGEKKVPLISPASSSPQLTGMPFFFRTVPSDRYQGAAAANLAFKAGFKNIGMVYEESSYGHGLAFTFMASITPDGGSVPVVVKVNRGAGDPKAAVAKLVEGKAAKANPLDAVFVSTSDLTYFAEFVRAAAAAKLGLPIFGGDAIASPEMTNMFKDSPALLKPVVISAFAQGSEAFQKKFAKEAPGVEYDGNAAQGYDAMHALLRAYDDASSSKEPDNIAAGILKQEFMGVSGPIAFDSKGDLKPHDGVYITATFDPKTAQLVLGKAIPLP